MPYSQDEQPYDNLQLLLEWTDKATREQKSCIARDVKSADGRIIIYTPAGIPIELPVTSPKEVTIKYQAIAQPSEPYVC